MEKRLITFFLVTMLTFMVYVQIVQWLAPAPQKIAQNEQEVDQEDGEKKDPEVDDQENSKPEISEAEDFDSESTEDDPKPATDQLPEKRYTLGSLDPNSGYQMLVYLITRGGAVERIELNNKRYLDIENKSGYLGYFAESDMENSKGCRINVVGPGTPAALAQTSDGKQLGLQPNDIILSINGQPVPDVVAYAKAMQATKPKQQIQIEVQRQLDAATAVLTFDAKLTNHPLSIINPELQQGEIELHNRLSFLTTFAEIGNQTIGSQKLEIEKLPSLYGNNWTSQLTEDGNAIEFTYILGNQALEKIGQQGNIEFIKRFRLAKKDIVQDETDESSGYHLDLDIQITNLGKSPINLAYRLDGPKGLPVEGNWYAYKTHPSSFGAAGIRDIVAKRVDRPHQMITNSKVVKKAKKNPDSPNYGLFEDENSSQIKYLGTDSLYFTSAILVNTPENAPSLPKFTNSLGRIAGEINKTRESKTDLTFRTDSEVFELKGGETHSQSFQLFNGPKAPDVLSNYGLDECISYGWFKRVAIPLTKILHFFYWIFGNYGVSIVLLTVLVRACLLPLGRKQVQNAQLMQELAPELKKITEKYKDNMEERAKAQREFYRKHNFNPLAGCLPMFLQLPIFIGLYRCLSVDIELRQAPLIPGIQWCSNLAAPDQFWRWDALMPGFLGSETGFLGPYLNILPLISVALMLVQQKMFTPPPQDEQQEMQMKMMKYMMIFFAFLFFRVPAGLCIYFITSSLWGIAERKLIPKPKPKKKRVTEQNESKPSLVAAITGRSDESTASIAEQRKKRQKQKAKRK